MTDNYRTKEETRGIKIKTLTTEITIVVIEIMITIGIMITTEIKIVPTNPNINRPINIINILTTSLNNPKETTNHRTSLPAINIKRITRLIKK